MRANPKSKQIDWKVNMLLLIWTLMRKHKCTAFQLIQNHEPVCRSLTGSGDCVHKSQLSRDFTPKKTRKEWFGIFSIYNTEGCQKEYNFVCFRCVNLWWYSEVEQDSTKNGFSKKIYKLILHISTSISVIRLLYRLCKYCTALQIYYFVIYFCTLSLKYIAHFPASNLWFKISQFQQFLKFWI